MPTETSTNTYIAGASALAGVALLILFTFTSIPLLLYVSTALMLVGAIITIYTFHQEENLEPKIIYLYLFLEMYMLAGIPLAEAVKKLADKLHSKTLLKIYKMMSLGYDYDEIFERVLKNSPESVRVYVENLFKSGVLGEGGLNYIRGVFDRLLTSMAAETEKLQLNVSSFIEIYAALGLTLPFILLIMVMLVPLGSMGIFSIQALMVMVFGIVLSSSLLMIYMVKRMMKKVRL